MTFIFWITNIGTELWDDKLFTTLLFFSTGSYFSLNKLNFVQVLRKVQTISFIAYPVLIFTDLYFSDINLPIYQLSIVVGIVFWINLSALLIEKTGMQINPLLTKSSFFIYALHGLLISKFIKISVLIFHPQSSVSLLLIYLFIPVFTIAISFISYLLLRKICPQLMAALTGNRN